MGFAATQPKSRSILIVEDDTDIRETLSGLLRGEGYDVGTCANGREALDRLRAGPEPDVILLDLMMPVMDGWQFRVQQKSDPRLASIPVLAISADATPKAAAIDADAYLKKPVDYDTLLATIERTLFDLERRRLHATQAETERLAALGTLAAGVAHEINNPLAYVAANLAFVAGAIDAPDAKSAAQVREALAEAREGCERIRQIVRDLQLFSRAEDAGDDGELVDVRAVLDSSANVVANEVRARAKLVKEYAADVPAVSANATRLGQVFLNLILNAAQAVPEGEPDKHEVRLVARAAGEQVIVEVRDTGQGIRPEVRARIFDPFFTTKPVGVGTGLGLSIAHRIVTALGGDLDVESEPGHGATFRVRLPAAPREASTGAKGSMPRLVASRRRARILVIDDEPMIGAMLERVLRHAHDVDSTADAVVAIDRITRGERFDLILCDLMMPGRTGEDVQRAIAAVAPDQARRMMFLTGGASSRRAQEFLERQPNPVVEKPFVVDDLLRRIDATLARLG
jgi:signal transduction histidine kinase